MNASDALVNNLEDNGEEGDEPEVAGQLARHSHSCDVRYVLWALLLSLVFWERANEHKD